MSSVDGGDFIWTGDLQRRRSEETLRTGNGIRNRQAGLCWKDVIAEGVGCVEIRCDWHRASAEERSFVERRDERSVGDGSVAMAAFREFAIELALVQGEDEGQTCGENHGRRSLTTEGTVKVVFSMPDEKDGLPKVDVLRMCLRHPDYPVELTFASGTPYKGASTASAPGMVLNDGDFNEGHLLGDLRLMMASFCGKSYCYADAGREFAIEGNRGWKDVFRLSFTNIKDYVCGTVKVQTNGVVEVEFQKNGLTQIRYQNQSTEKLRPAVCIVPAEQIRGGSVACR